MVTNYAATKYAPQLADITWSIIQLAENASLRLITGCHSITPENHLHTETIRNTIRQYVSNRVLGTKPPNISDTKKTARSTLHHLISNFSCILKSYLRRLDETISDEYPTCGSSPLLFTCHISSTVQLAPRHSIHTGHTLSKSKLFWSIIEEH